MKKIAKITLGTTALGLEVLMTNAMLFPSASSNATTATTNSIPVGVTIKEFMQIAVDTSALSLTGDSPVAPSAAGTEYTGNVNVAVTSNSAKGYTLSVYTNDSTTAMKHSNSSVETAINSVSTASGYNTSTGIANLANNTWGFRKYANSVYSNWFGVGADSTHGTVIDTTSAAMSGLCVDLDYPIPASCSSSTYNAYTINFGTKLTSAMPAGTYTNNVVFSATANS